jgi:DNA-binding transcriptional regulator YiaG
VSAVKEWLELAACKAYPFDRQDGKGRIVDPWFPENIEECDTAKRFCGRCEVRDECLTDALIDEGLPGVRPEGIRGGKLPRERHPKRRSLTSGPISAEEDQHRKDLWELGFTDDSIARRVGASRAAITAWRIRRDLPVQSASKQHQLTEHRKKLWEQGWNDREIADASGVTRDSVQRWRQAHGLSSRELSRTAAVNALRRELYDSGLSDGAIAARTGVTYDAIRSWRVRRNLPQNEEVPA